MMPPISVTAVILRRCARLNGVSRTISTNLRRSLSTTSAARAIRLSDRPCATDASVFIEQGATIIPSDWNEPLAMAAPISRTLCTTWASASTSRRCRPVSWCSVNTAESETIRCVSTPGVSRNCCNSRTPYTAPVAPVMAMISRAAGLSGIQQGFQFARFKHFIHDVGTADELAFDVELRNGRPVRVFLDALAHVLIVQHVDGGDVLDAAGFQDLDGAAGKAALRELGGALHEQHDRGRVHGFFDPGLYVAHSCLRGNGIDADIL